MEFKIDNIIFEKYPTLNVGILVVKNMDNTGKAEKIIELIRKKEEEIKSEFDIGTLAQNPRIKVWREAYRKFGVKPKNHKSSIENLYQGAIQGRTLRPINKIVDIYNYIALKHMIPVGGEDLDKIEGDISLTVAEENEEPVKLLGDKEARPPYQGEVIYKDNISTICRRFNWREADRTKFTEQSSNAVLVVEGLPPITKGEIESILKEIKRLIKEYCGGKIKEFILNKESPKVEF